MPLMWFFLGALVVLFIMILPRWISRKRVRLSWASWLGIVIGAMLLFFCIAWSVTSLLEGENQAAVMGLLFFGVPALIVFGLTRRKAMMDKQVKS